MQLSIVIVNYRTPELTLCCVERVVATIDETKDYEIIVVDNHSEDNSEVLICSKFPQVIWINNPTNEGFGRANNLGLAQAKGEYVLFLNSDMVLLPNTVGECIKQIKTDNSIGVLGCTLLNEDGTVQKSTYQYISEYLGIIEKNLVFDYFIKKGPVKIQGLMGSFLLVPKSVLDIVGGFDPEFFMYSEEMELCYRIAKAGYKIEYFDKVQAIHKNGASSNKDWALKQNLLSNALLFYKIRGFVGYLVYHILFLINTLTNFFVMWKIGTGYRKHYFNLQKAYFSNFMYYWIIPLFYSRSGKHVKRQLKRN